jgi:hypothetical protein
MGPPDEDMAALPYLGCPLLLPTALSTYIIKQGTGPLPLYSVIKHYGMPMYWVGMLSIHSWIFAIP